MPNTSKSLIVNTVSQHYPYSIYFIYDCQIWELKSWKCLKSLQVPALIVPTGKQFLPTNNIDDGLPIESVTYVNSSVESLVLSYHCKSGLLMLENYDLKSWYDEDILQNNFRHFPSFITSLDGPNIAVSDDQQFLSMRSDDVSQL